MDQVLIVAAEASSVTYAQRILEAWKAQGRKVHAFGVGSQDMEDIGFERLGKSEEMAVVGAAEIISAYSHLKSVFDSLVAEAEKRRPKVAIVMDYPEFNLMLAKKLHALGIPVVYYISPQVWAWRKGRVKTIKKYCKKVFVLFPFEVPFYEEHGVPVEFVGHPLLDELDERLIDDLEYRKNHRNQCGIRDSEIVLGLMPGSRRLEVKQHLDIQLDAARILSKKFPNLKVLILTAPTFTKEYMQDRLENFRLPYMLLKDEPFRMIHLVDMMLVASGTATLQVGLLKKPMVIMYKMKWLTGVFAKLFVRGTKYFGLVNLILNKEAVPELFQSEVTAENLAAELERYVLDKKYHDSVVSDLGQVRQYLGDKGATQRVVKALEEYFV
ncbi:lipid-A-disaccharide synthase [Bdellovibrio bacteriovorus]|uniref:Lipid-A-disaccharide synthase n=1 Tax=Bdellovibrio bacteriovorus (strain ATCC 15356 / DSM 50701 / NCIMB 9529 / HD100) TaxID=264462 RepID=Q6MMX5_BDEBA|nr:lipid-A-disaccharide synthase [Bdellovibrio bacteriovorus]AHZ84050.1 lipid A disaccharide synthase [Bdellovibrio bacteriovorus]BEV67933.1 Lipid-A-disaccharide synthase [Bdellovibrio bacteriovorus]CAE79378.1 lipid A disaccharide synthase [Bdellovibrio bacteriovorus HD100]